MKILTLKLIRDNDTNFALALRVIANNIDNGKTESKDRNTLWRIF